MNITEIAQQVDKEMRGTSIDKACETDLTEFLRRCLAKMAEQNNVDPVATVQHINGVTIGYMEVSQPVGANLYTEAQLLAVQQKTAEACLKVCENTTTLDTGEEFREGFRHAAKLIWIAIRNGEWRDFS